MTHDNKLWMTTEPEPLMCPTEIFQLIPIVLGARHWDTNFLNGPKVDDGSVALREGQW